MPPKKKGKKGKKKSKNGELTDEDRLKLKAHEIDSLKDHLAYRRDLSRRANYAFEEIKERLEETNKEIEEIESTHKASNAYLTHQYKTMQNELDVKIDQLNSELKRTKKQLEQTEAQLQHEIAERKRIVTEKDDKIWDLEQKISNMQIAYDGIMQFTLDNFNDKINVKKADWENRSLKLQTKNKVLLAELGLKIHDI